MPFISGNRVRAFKLLFIYSEDTLQMVTCISALQKIFVSIPKFMSPYITLLFTKIAEVESNVISCTKDTEMLRRILNKFKNNLGEQVAPRLLLPNIQGIVSAVTTNSMVSHYCFWNFSIRTPNFSSDWMCLFK